MTDLTYATKVLLRAIDGLPAQSLLTIDLIRDECDAAGLTSAEKSGAFRSACTDGYLTGVFLSLPGFDVNHPVHAAIPSTHEAGKGRYVKLWRRTAKPVPAHVCETVVAQENSTQIGYDGGSKTAPGVASTNTGSLAPIPHYRKEA